MRRLLSASFVAISVVACGKTPLADDAKAGPPDDPGAVNVCELACVPRAEADRAKHAVRSRPAPRVAAAAERSRIAPDELRTVAKPGSAIRDHVSSDGFLYWTERGDPRLECRPDGSMPSCSAHDLHVRHLSGTLRRARIADGHVEVLAAELEDVDGILVMQDFAYVSTAQGLLRVPSSGGTSTLLPTDQPAFGRPALDPVSWTVYVQTRDKLLAVEP